MRITRHWGTSTSWSPGLSGSHQALHRLRDILEGAWGRVLSLGCSQYLTIQINPLGVWSSWRYHSLCPIKSHDSWFTSLVSGTLMYIVPLVSIAIKWSPAYSGLQYITMVYVISTYFYIFLLYTNEYRDFVLYVPMILWPRRQHGHAAQVRRASTSAEMPPGDVSWWFRRLDPAVVPVTRRFSGRS